MKSPYKIIVIAYNSVIKDGNENKIENRSQKL